MFVDVVVCRVLVAIVFMGIVGAFLGPVSVGNVEGSILGVLWFRIIVIVVISLVVVVFLVFFVVVVVFG